MKTNEYVAVNENDSRDGFLGRGRAFGDVTNSLGKRTPRSPGGSFLENENWRGKLEEDDEFGRRVCKGVEKLVKEKENASLKFHGSENVPLGDVNSLALFEAKRLCRSKSLDDGGDESTEDNVALDVSQVSLGIGELQKPLNCDLHLLRGETMIHGILKGGGSRDSCLPSACLTGEHSKASDSAPMIDGDFQDDYGKITADIMRSAAVIDDESEMPAMCAHDKIDKGKYVAGHWQFSTSDACNLQVVDSQESKTDAGESLNQAPLDKSSSEACLEEPYSLGSKLFGFEQSAKAHERSSGDVGFNPHECSESTYGCNFNDSSFEDFSRMNGYPFHCAFVAVQESETTFAAYLWSDLHYQDAIDRLAALKKSRRQVKQLVASYSYNEGGEITHDGSDKSAKLELDLMHQWRSLFLHTEDALLHESNRLQSDLLKLEDLREDCTRDLEMIKGAPSDIS